MERVYVMLSAYNGEAYIEQQMDSILNQQGVEVKLLVRDDGSTDNTIRILRTYEKQYANISLSEGENLGYIRSFLWLVSQCPAEKGAFYAFSDQDDIWDVDKLQAAVLKIKETKKQGAVLYYSDLEVVDQDGKFIRRANSWEGKITKYMISVFIGIRGCTMVYNDELQKMLRAAPPKDVFGHDTYIALTAFWLGTVIYDQTPYIRYRQTGKNLSVTGVSGWDHLKKNFIYLRRRLTVRSHMHERNAKELLSHYGSENYAALKDLYLVANYRKSLAARMKLLFSGKFKAFSIPIRLFNDLMIVIGKL